MKAYELLAKPENWTQGVMCRDKKTNIPDFTFQSDPNTHCYCILGALKYCYSKEYLNGNLIEKIESHLSIAPSLWNDDPNRKHEEVVTLLKELDI